MRSALHAFLRRTLRLAPWIAASALIAVFAHVAMILLAPRAATRDALSRYPGAYGAAQWLDADALAPFEDPANAVAICKFDLTLDPGAVAIGAAAGGETPTSIALYDSFGLPFYALTARAAQRGALDLVVTTQERKDELEAAEPDDAPATLRVVAPTPRGFALIRAWRAPWNGAPTPPIKCGAA